MQHSICNESTHSNSIVKTCVFSEISCYIIQEKMFSNFHASLHSWENIYHFMRWMWYCTLKKQIEANTTLEDAFYQSEWVKVDLSSVIFIFVILCVLLLNASQLFYMCHLANIERFSSHSNFSFWISNFIHM